MQEPDDSTVGKKGKERNNGRDCTDGCQSLVKAGHEGTRGAAPRRGLEGFFDSALRTVWETAPHLMLHAGSAEAHSLVRTEGAGQGCREAKSDAQGWGFRGDWEGCSPEAASL